MHAKIIEHFIPNATDYQSCLYVIHSYSGLTYEEKISLVTIMQAYLNKTEIPLEHKEHIDNIHQALTCDLF